MRLITADNTIILLCLKCGPIRISLDLSYSSVHGLVWGMGDSHPSINNYNNYYKLILMHGWTPKQICVKLHIIVCLLPLHRLICKTFSVHETAD